MQYSIDQTMSLMIPRVFPQWTTKKEITRVFNDQQIGRVYKVSIQHIKNEEKNGVKIPIYTAHVYFYYWFNNKIAYNFQQQIIKKKQARIVYDDPWFWTIFKNNQKKLSKKDKRRLSDAQNVYITQIKKKKKLYEKIADTEMKLKDNLKNLQNDLKRRNEEMQKLQDFTIQYGLNVPFWSSNEPPLLSESAVDLMNAKTAVDAAEFVLNDEEEDEEEDEQEETDDNNIKLSEYEEEILNDNAYHTAVYSAEQVLWSDDDDNGTTAYSDDNTTNSSVYDSSVYAASSSSYYSNNSNTFPANNNNCFQLLPPSPSSSFFPQYYNNMMMMPTTIIMAPFTQFPQPIIHIHHYYNHMCY